MASTINASTPYPVDSNSYIWSEEIQNWTLVENIV